MLWLVHLLVLFTIALTTALRAAPASAIKARNDVVLAAGASKPPPRPPPPPPPPARVNLRGKESAPARPGHVPGRRLSGPPDAPYWEPVFEIPWRGGPLQGPTSTPPQRVPGVTIEPASPAPRSQPQRGQQPSRSPTETPPTSPPAARNAPLLPPFTQGGKTTGVLRTASGDTPLQSGWTGPASGVPRGTSGFDIVTRTHVEGHAVAAMRQGGITEATLYINCPNICASCVNLLPRMLPTGSRLTVVTPISSTTFVGSPP